MRRKGLSVKRLWTGGRWHVGCVAARDMAMAGMRGNQRPRIAARAIAVFACLVGVRFPYTAVGFRYDLNHGRW